MTRFSSHNCVCLHAPGYKPAVCKCGVYRDKHGNWCANENCRAKLPDEDWRTHLIDLVAYVLGVEQ